jgi:hypothetical protein
MLSAAKRKRLQAFPRDAGRDDEENGLVDALKKTRIELQPGELRLRTGEDAPVAGA